MIPANLSCFIGALVDGNGKSVTSGLQVLSQASLKVYNKGEVLDSGQPQQLFVLLRGCVCLHYPEGTTYLAGASSHACSTCPNQPVCLLLDHVVMNNAATYQTLLFAEPGAVLCAWPVLPSKDQFTSLVATTIVQTYSIPFVAFKVPRGFTTPFLSLLGYCVQP